MSSSDGVVYVVVVGATGAAASVFCRLSNVNSGPAPKHHMSERTDRSRTVAVPCPSIFPRKALVFALTDDFVVCRLIRTNGGICIQKNGLWSNHFPSSDEAPNPDLPRQERLYLT